MKLPFFQFYPSDYMRDTRALSLAAKGGWVDVMCLLHSSSTRGTVKLPMVGWARVMGATVDQSEAVINELGAMNVADVKRECNGDVTLSSRRMLREYITREQTRLRVDKHRRNGACNGDGNAVVTGQKSEVRSQKPETIINPNDPCAELGKPASAPGGAGQLPLGPVETDPATDPVLMSFPTVGGELRSWPLRESKAAEWRAAYPGVAVDSELRKLLQWCIDNPRKRKTARGMTAFLSRCLSRKQDDGGSGGENRKGGEFDRAW